MSNALRSAHWRRRRQDAWRSFEIKRDTVVATVAAALAFSLSKREELWGNVWLPLIAALLSVLTYEAVRFAWHFVITVPREAHDEHIKTISDMERTLASALSHTSDLLTEVSGLRERRRKNLQLANELTRLKKIGLHSIRNEFEHNPHNLQIYLDRERRWCDELEVAMRAGGCSDAQVSSVIDVTYSEIGMASAGANYGPKGNYLIGLLEMRLRRLQSLIEQSM